MHQTFYSHGKLMLAGEYAVLHGAVCFSLPVKKGQKMITEFTESDNYSIDWSSFGVDGDCWFSCLLSLPNLIVLETNDRHVALHLQRFLINAKVLNPFFLAKKGNYKVDNYLEFDLQDGFGSSSTLTNNIAQWANINPFALHFNAFKGSGFDVAVAQIGKPLLYTMNGSEPKIEVVNWNKNFTDKLFFIHLNKKQNSRQSISENSRHPTISQVMQLSKLSKLIAINEDYFEFCLLLELAEAETSEFLNKPTIKQELFNDFKGSIKSLGAWGGDYILATGENTENYFKEKGFNKIYTFKDLID